MKYGNLCIAGHNYKNNTFFSNLSKLEIGDIINIKDINGNTLDYKIYDIYKSTQTDLSSVNQDTNNLRVITLITCDNFNDNFRTVVKAKEISTK